MKRAIAASLLLPFLGACGGVSDFGSAMDVAKAAACESPNTIAPGVDKEFLANSVDCTYNGHDIIIGWFESSSAMRAYRHVAGRVGPGHRAYGGDFVVECMFDRADCDALLEAAGFLSESRDKGGDVS